MKVLMFGRGVIAGFYGWALGKAGHDVTFYVRPGRAAEYGDSLHLQAFDLRTKLTGTRIDERVPVRYREDLPPDHDYELIIVSVQHYRFAEVANFLGSRVSQATVLVFNNFFVEPLEAIAPLPASQVVWGFPQAGGGFGADGVLRGSLLPKVFFGTFGTEPTARDLAVRQLFRQAGFGTSEQRDMRGWLFTHFAVNVGLLSQALRAGSMSKLLGSREALADAILGIRELIPLLEAKGVDMQAQGAALALFKLPPLVGVTVLQLALKLLPAVRLVLEAHANVEELELTARDGLAEARRLGVAVPRLEALEPYFARQQTPIA